MSKNTTSSQSSRKNRSGGRAGAGGYDFQAEATVVVESKLLAAEGLNWPQTGSERVPIALLAETGGGGDDLQIVFGQDVVVEVQAKSGLQRGDDLWEALIELAHAAITNEKVYGVLLTNRRASRSITEELREGIQRIGQGRADDLSEIAREFLQRLSDAGIKDAVAACSRLSIEMRDFGTGEPGEEETLSVLRRVIADPTLAEAARGILVADAHDLMRQRGRRDAGSLIRLLQQAGIALSSFAANVEVIRENYRTAMVRSNECFTVAGFNIQLPITEAWAQLRSLSPEGHPNRNSLADYIRRYHEWHTLVDASSSDLYGKPIKIEEAIESNQFSVVLAGPGSGKSTLSRRIIFGWLQKGETALRVRLRTVAARMHGHGDTFEDAMLFAAVPDGTVNTDMFRPIVQSASFLVADGLDETDPLRAEIASHLRSWALSVPGRRLVVTTRPVGHEVAWFEGWPHLEILPLRRPDIRSFAESLYGLLPSDVLVAHKPAQQAEAFLGTLDRSRTSAVAARNPLFLSLLAGLYVAGEELSGRRFLLLERMVKLVQNRQSSDRPFPVSAKLPITHLVRKGAGWELLNRPLLSREELIKRISKIIINESGLAPIAAEIEINNALEFWEERGLMECFSTAGDSATAFVHMYFRDHAVAAYTEYLSKEEFAEWVRSAASSANFRRMREALTLCGGASHLEELVRVLLAMDDPADPINEMALMAADALSEAETSHPQIQRDVIEHLLPRLVSPVPVAGYETANRLRALARLRPDLIGPTANELSRHTSQPWTREIGCALALIAGEQYVDDDALLEAYATFVATRPELTVLRSHPDFDAITARFMKEFVEDATDYLLRKDAPQIHTDAVRRMVHKAPMLSEFHAEIVRRYLNWLPHEEQKKIEEMNSFLPPSLFQRERFTKRLREDERSFLEILLAAAKKEIGTDLPSNEATGRCSLSEVLHRTLRLAKWTSNDFFAVLEPSFRESFEAVFRGAIHATTANPADIYASVHSAIEVLTNQPELKLFEVLELSDGNSNEPGIQAELDWERARVCTLRLDLLLHAISGPVHYVSLAATHLLWSTFPIEERGELFKQVLDRGDHVSLAFASKRAQSIWGAEAADVILSRLEKNVDDDCYPLIDALAEVCEEKHLQRTAAVFRTVLGSESALCVGFTISVANSLELDTDLLPEFRLACQWWLEEGPAEYGDYIRTVPHNAAEELLSHLIAGGHLTIAEIGHAAATAKKRPLEAALSVAVAELCRLLIEDESLVTPTLEAVGRGELPPEIITGLMEKGSELILRHFDILGKIAASPHAEAALAAVQAIQDSGMKADVFRTTLRPLLTSSPPEVRDEILRLLRRRR